MLKCIVNSAEYSINYYIVYSVQCTVYSVQCTVYSVQCTVYSVQCTVYTVHCTLYTVQGTLYTDTINCTLIQYTVYFTLYTVHCREQCTGRGHRKGVEEGDTVALHLDRRSDGRTVQCTAVQSSPVHCSVHRLLQGRHWRG